MIDALPVRIGERLARCPGVRAVTLGGSRVSGLADARSDIDLGLYYEPEDPVDLEALRALVADIDDHGGADAVTDLGAWGPWVNGGAWLQVEGRRVDLIYRNLSSVAEAIRRCREGRVETSFQVGHPAGFSAQIYAAEVHLCLVLQDPHGVLAALKEQTSPYPPALRRALVSRLWEASFSLDAAIVSAERGDVHHVAGSAFRAVVCMVEALLGLNERYWTNEKGSVALADALPLHPEGFAETVRSILGRLGTRPSELERNVRALRTLLHECESLAAPYGEGP